MDRLKNAECEDTSDHAGDFKRQLLRGIEAIDAIRDGSLKRIRQREVFKIHEP